MQAQLEKKFSDPQNVKVEKIKQLVNDAAHAEAKGGLEGPSYELTLLIESLRDSDALFALNKALNERDTY